jgi:hypothetical protein
MHGIRTGNASGSIGGDAALICKYRRNHGTDWRYEMNPFLGTWVANLEKSHRHANHQFQSATLTFEVDGDVVSLTHAGVNKAGKHESGTTILRADGIEREVSPHAPGVVAVTKWVGTHALAMEARKEGRAVGTATYAISEDGRTLTATVGGVDAAGKSFDQVIVFDREPGTQGEGSADFDGLDAALGG